MRKYNLPVDYTSLRWYEIKAVRLQYIEQQKGMCHYCGCALDEDAPNHIRDINIYWGLFPDNFLKYPIHLQHNHDTRMTDISNFI